MNRFLLTTSTLVALTNAATAQVTFHFIGLGFATDVSADGSVVVGNTEGDFETFRWTVLDGIVPLGRATVPVLGIGAGAPDVSADGTMISATILGANGTYATQGRWTRGSGWQEMMPPTPPDGGLIDSAYGSAWGLSDDGNTLLGLYWRPGQLDGLAHASRWTPATGVVDLGSGGGNSRANDANADGTVIVGWDEDPSFGTWWPTVWVNGVRTTLTQTVGFAEADAVTPDGTMIVGSSWRIPHQPWHPTMAAAWRWNGASWVEEILGFLPGTAAPFGLAVGSDVTADGSMVVGFNRFSGPTDATGFIWTAATGIMDVEDFLLNNGVTPDPNFDIRTISAVSDDGTVLVGSGQDLVAPFRARSFLITVPAPCSLLGDINQDGQLDGRDIAGFIRAKLGQPPEPGEQPACANYGGTLQQDMAAFIADLLAN
ncbi:MAG: hypothetical protein ACE5F9_09590 [Phycisphaerae bacterium]